MVRLANLRLMALVLVAVGLMRMGLGEAGQPDKGSQGVDQALTVSGAVALASLVSLSDGYLRKMADSFHILAAADAVQSADWERIRGPLAEAARRNIAALNWFALPDGSYWSVQNGKEKGNLATRDYFPTVLAGKTVTGDLVISKATGKPVAIVAVPVRGREGTVIGILGASVYLDQLSALLEKQMGLDETMIFYSFDHTALVALDWDPGLIFLEPKETGDEDLIRAFDEMLSQDQGTVSYQFRGRERTVIFQTSPVTHWWYAFGLIPEGRETRMPPPGER